MLRQGGVIIYPTETFFGIGCRVLDAAAVDRIYAVKSRSTQLPLPVLGDSLEQLALVAALPDAVAVLLDRFWPGPLTLLVPAREEVPDAVTAGTGNIAVRISSHETARKLACAAGQPIVSSSANISRHSPVTQAADLSPELTSQVDGIVLSGRQPTGGLPSTIVEWHEGELVLRRRGAVSENALRAAGFRLRDEQR